MQIDMHQVATTVAALLGPYLAKAGEGFGKKAGEAAWDKVVALYQAIRHKFAADKDEKAQETLRRLEEQPTDEKRQEALVEVLTDKAQANPAFAQELQRLVQVITQDETITQFLTQVYDMGRVKKIINIGLAGVVNID